MRVKLNANHPEAGPYADFTRENIYEVIGIEADDFRIVNDQGNPYLYPRDLFVVVDPHEPEEWITEYGAEGERYSYPKELSGAGFFEDWFEGDEQSRATFQAYLARKAMISP
ncbi:MAG: hypothetical protein ACRELG_11610 [Gemmataceae bacterium]